MNDKLMHLAAGAAAAVAGLGLGLVAVAAHLAPLQALPLAAAVASIVAGVTKEGADWLDNRAHPGMHGVEVLDVLATAAPGLAVAVALRWWLA